MSVQGHNFYHLVTTGIISENIQSKTLAKIILTKREKKPGFLFVTCMSLLFTRRNWQVTLLTNIINGKNLTLFGLKISGHLVQCGQFIV